MDATKLSIEMKGLKITYEGPAQFLNEGLAGLCEQLSALDLPAVEIEQRAGSAVAGDGAVKMSTTDMAVRMSSKSGPDLVMAAAAHLRFTKGKEDFKRSELLAEMKSAKGFYKQTYNNNLSKSLDGLMKSGRLSSPSAETYALPHTEEETLHGLLGI